MEVLNKCNCGRTKLFSETSCTECRFGSAHKVATTGRCDIHNTFFTIPGGSCSKCIDVLSKQFETDCKKTEILEQKSARYNTGKTQTREIDPAFILGIGEVLTKSREKYDHFNWAKSTKLSTPYESMMRHIMAFQSGEEIDKETQSHHLLHAATNLMFMYYHITNNPEESDDRFFKKKKK